MGLLKNIVNGAFDLMTSSLEEGVKAPEFTLDDSYGKPVSLADYLGKKPVVLYFYPKDDTPGCTQQACTFRDMEKEIEEAGAAVLGISRDTVESHVKFREKYGLNFPLLADVDGAVSKAYGAATPLGMSARYTYVIDTEGVIRKVIKDIDAGGHPHVALKTVAEITGSQS